MAVDVLIRAVSTTSDDPTKNVAGCHKIGDPVDIGPVGFFAGVEELKTPQAGGRFFILTISDVSEEQARRFIEAHEEIINFATLETRIHIARRYRLVLSELPAGVRSQINTTGRYTATWAQVRSFIENKVTLAREAGSAAALLRRG